MPRNALEMDPLKAAHEIGYATRELHRMASAMEMVGLAAGEDLHALAAHISGLSKACADGIMREASERYQQQTASTGDMIVAVLDSCLTTPDKVKEA